MTMVYPIKGLTGLEIPNPEVDYEKLTNDTIVLKWTPIAKAQSYKIWISQAGEKISHKVISDKNAKFSGLKSNTIYTFKLIAISDKFQESEKAEIEVYTRANSPIIFTSKTQGYQLNYQIEGMVKILICTVCDTNYCMCFLSANKISSVRENRL